ncbi:MAG TPA: heavy metal sensor histidine kinase [Blastocatellia bacterium]|nr:heavy metal sensor histidine kinase [Blastocatellia bacterium]
MKIQILDSVRVRLTLWYVGVLALVLIAFSVMVYTLLSRALYQRVDDGLQSSVSVAIKSLSNDLEEGQTVLGAAQSTSTELFNGQQAMAIFEGEGKLLSKNVSDDDFYTELPDEALIPDDEIHLYTAAEPDDDDDELHRLAVQRVRIPPSNTRYIILVSQPLETLEEELESLRETIYYAMPIALLMAGLGGWFLARQSLAPVVAMSEQARVIGASSLDQKLPVANPRDELGQLAITFNELLARLDSAFAQQRQFMADASHELRTPISVIRTTAGVILDKPHRDESEYRDAVTMMDEQSRRLTRIVEDMFALARVDSGRYPLRKSKFYLDELLEQTARAASVLASRKNTSIDIANSSEALFYGDEDLMRQMILNLLDNAIKYTPADGTVRLSLARKEEKYFIEVSDTGTGIPAEAQSHIFERFYRTDKARSRSEGAGGSGAGLGLAIARWIAESHEGKLELIRSDKSGSAFIASFPIPRNM